MAQTIQAILQSPLTGPGELPGGLNAALLAAVIRDALIPVTEGRTEAGAALKQVMVGLNSDALAFENDTILRESLVDWFFDVGALLGLDADSVEDIVADRVW